MMNTTNTTCTTVPSQSSVLEHVGRFFYIVDYKDTSFKDPGQVPDYMKQAVPLFISFMILEYFLLWLQGKNTPRLGDTCTSIGHGMLYDVIKMFTKGLELAGYEWLYQYRLLDFDWDSPVTWVTAAIAVDFGGYWGHRALHEVAWFWTTHQVHHSSEDMNFSSSLRQPLFLVYRFAQPLALLGLPLSAVMVHMHLNLLYQFWVHTEAIGKCGPLEWIFTTPSHHRVHHGSNPYCLDKNYGGFLIIWDRMFGTFEEEREKEKIVYGLVNQPQTYNVIKLQFFYMKELIEKSMSQETFGNKLRALFYGPGWFPGTPRLGNPPSDEYLQRSKYDPSLPELPIWNYIYFGSHAAILFLIQQSLVEKFMDFTLTEFSLMFGFLCLSVSMVAVIYEGWQWYPFVEMIRCWLFIICSSILSITPFLWMNTILLAYFVGSAFIWTHRCMDLMGLIQDQEQRDKKLE